MALGAASCRRLAFQWLSCCERLAAAQLASLPSTSGPAPLTWEGCLEEPFPLLQCCSPAVSPLGFSAGGTPRRLFPSLPSLGLKWTQADRPLECSLAISFGFLGSVLCKSEESCCSFWGALLGDPLPGDRLQAFRSGPWALSLQGGCLLGAQLWLWGSARVLGRQGAAWGLQESGLSLPFCCSASLRLFSSSRFLAAASFLNCSCFMRRFFRSRKAFRTLYPL